MIGTTGRAPTDSPTERIRLDLPADPRHAATARVVVASLAADLGFSVDDIDDLRLALNEAVSVLTDSTDPADGPDVDPAVSSPNGDAGRIEIELEVAPTLIEIEVRHGGVSEVPDLDELAERILAAVVDEHHLGPGLVRLTKSASAMSQPSGTGAGEGDGITR